MKVGLTNEGLSAALAGSQGERVGADGCDELSVGRNCKSEDRIGVNVEPTAVQVQFRARHGGVV